MVGQISSAIIHVELWHGEFLRWGSINDSLGNGEPPCSPNDFLAKFLGVQAIVFPATIESINFHKSSSAQVLGQAYFFESCSKTLCLYETTETSGVEI